MQEIETGKTSGTPNEDVADDVADIADDDRNSDGQNNEFDDDAEILVADVDDLETDDGGTDEEELVDEIESSVASEDESASRYQHESEVFGFTEVSTGRAKLELLEEERLLKEMLSDSF